MDAVFSLLFDTILFLLSFQTRWIVVVTRWFGLEVNRLRVVRHTSWFEFKYMYSSELHIFQHVWIHWHWNSCWILSMSLFHNCWYGYSYWGHYNDVIMIAMASQITSPTLFTQPFIRGADQIKHQCSASLAFVMGIHRSPVNSPLKGLVTKKMFPFDDVTMVWNRCHKDYHKEQRCNNVHAIWDVSLFFLSMCYSRLLIKMAKQFPLVLKLLQIARKNPLLLFCNRWRVTIKY